MDQLELPKSYVLTKGPDGITWLSLEPAISDLRKMMENPQLAAAKHNIEVVLVFLDSMVNECRIQEWERAKLDREDDDEASYKDSLH